MSDRQPVCRNLTVDGQGLRDRCEPFFERAADVPGIPESGNHCHGIGGTALLDRPRQRSAYVVSFAPGSLYPLDLGRATQTRFGGSGELDHPAQMAIPSIAIFPGIVQPVTSVVGHGL